MINDAFSGALTADAPAPEAQDSNYSTPEEYRAATGKRFRMTQAERAEYGITNESSNADKQTARQAAFIARINAGTL